MTKIPANIRLGEDVLKTPWSRLEDVFSVTFFCLPRRLEDIIARRLANTSWKRLEDVLMTSWKTSWRRLESVLKTSLRRLEDVLGKRIANRSWRRKIAKTSWKTKSVTLQTSLRRLEDVLENKKYLLGCFWSSSLMQIWKVLLRKVSHNYFPHNGVRNVNIF